jgi:hypothetical protein
VLGGMGWRVQEHWQGHSLFHETDLCISHRTTSRSLDNSFLRFFNNVLQLFNCEFVK